jgi:hypothetical protein
VLLLDACPMFQKEIANESIGIAPLKYIKKVMSASMI